MRSLRWTCVLLTIGCAELAVPDLDSLHPASPRAPEAPLIAPSALQPDASPPAAAGDDEGVVPDSGPSRADATGHEEHRHGR